MRWRFSSGDRVWRTSGLRGVGTPPQIEEPPGGEIVAEFERLREIAPELLAQAVALWLQVLGHARPLAQLDDDRVGSRRKQRGSVRRASAST